MNGVLRHVDSYTGHVVRASSLMDDIDLKGEHLQNKHIEKKNVETNMQPTVHLYVFFVSFFLFFICFFYLMFLGVLHIIMYTGIS